MIIIIIFALSQLLIVVLWMLLYKVMWPLIVLFSSPWQRTLVTLGIRTPLSLWGCVEWVGGGVERRQTVLVSVWELWGCVEWVGGGVERRQTVLVSVWELWGCVEWVERRGECVRVWGLFSILSKVHACRPTRYLSSFISYEFVLIMTAFVDVNECETGSSCHDNAACTNTEGGFDCSCLPGYQGDGRTCLGKHFFSIIKLYITG